MEVIVGKKLISIIGAGNIGLSIANGLATSKEFSAEEIILTNRKFHLLDGFEKQGFTLEQDNCKAIKNSKIVIITVDFLMSIKARKSRKTRKARKVRHEIYCHCEELSDVEIP